MALPYLNLYIGDIMKDTDVLSPAAFGGYVRLLFKLHAADPRGEVHFTLPQLCRVFAAATLEETQEILNEITDPAHNICEYSRKSDKHYFVNRRMKKEALKSQVRSEAGKLGAAKTNAKNRQNKKFAEQFTAAEEEAVTVSNDAIKNQQNYNTGINNNTGNDDSIKEGPEENFVVPAMLSVWKYYKPKYITQQEKDFPALRKIAMLISREDSLNISDKTDIEQIKTTWGTIVEFLLTDMLFKDYQISQVEKYFQAICSKYFSRKEETAGAAKKTTLQNNADAAKQARDILNRKYGNG